MNYIAEFNIYNNLVANDEYVKKNGATNILFIGGCRSYVYAIFFEEICKYIPWFMHAQFGIATIGVHIVDLFKIQKTQNITNTIENADIIICEQIRNYSFLNTSKNCEQNIFNNFNIKKTCKIINIPNLEFRYYTNELIFDNKNDINNSIIIKNLKEKSLARFIEHCQKYNFDIFGEYILNNVNNKRLFISFNHPCNCTFLEAFKQILKNCFQYELLDSDTDIFKNIQIFDGDINGQSVICNSDYECGLSKNVI
jgi:hypothetical protein